MRIALSLFLLFLLLPATGGLAQTVHYYKSVHADGVVEYSDTRAGSGEVVQEIRIYQDGDAALEQGRARVQEMQSAAEDLGKRRSEESAAKGEHAKRIARARQEVAEAERNLQSVLASKRSATPYRIELAENRLALAHKKLADIRRAGP